MDRFIKGLFGKKVTLVQPIGENVVDDVCERMVNYLINVSKKENIGIQFVTDRNGNLLFETVSDISSYLIEDDLEWIFDGLGIVQKSVSKNCIFAPDAECVYALSLTEEYFKMRDYFIDRDYILELLGEMIKTRMKIQITAGEENTSSCRILISIPGKMGAKQKALLALAFRHMRVVALSEANPEQIEMPFHIIRSCLEALIFGLNKRINQEKSTSDKEISFIDDFDDLLDTCEEKETKEIHGEQPPEKTDHMTELDELIGLDDVKIQVKKISAFAKMKKAMSDSNKIKFSMTLNMEFIGNPGTAKTTVARILAGVFFDIGILKNRNIIEVGRADLVAGYVGQTAAKVKEVFKKAKGRLLFIDEAYSLVDNKKNDFGDEAIEAIVQEMENNREDTIVILAGYPDEMADFFKRNPGLRSRVPFSIKFNDYSVDTLVKIFEFEASKRGFEISSEAAKKVENICAEASSNPEFGNGRFCRNLVENAIINFAFRNYDVEDGVEDKEKEEDASFILLPEDFSMPAGMSMVRKEKKFGLV